MLKDNNKNMSEEQAIAIAENFFSVLKALFKIKPLYLSGIEKQGKEITIICDSEDKVRKVITKRINDKEDNEIRYKFFYKNRTYQILFWDDEEIYGYVSQLPPGYLNCSGESYVLCDICELRDENDKKYSMEFAFDIEKRTFLEFFELYHKNIKGTKREYYNDIGFDKIYRGKEII